MQFIYFILAVILIIWWWPYSLIVIILLVIIALLSVYSSSNNKPAKRDASYYVSQSYLEVRQQQGKKIQQVIDVLMTLGDADMYKIINRLQSHLKYLERNNIYVSDLYDYILRTANERINTAKRDFVKRECGIVIQIITQLKDGVSADDIVRTILPQKENEVLTSSNGEETVEAILALPGEVDIHNIPKIQTLIKEIDSIVDNTRYGETTVNHILQLLECRNEDNQTLYKKTIDSIISGLSRLGYGIAPNYEIDRKRLNFGDICVIYSNKEHHPVKSTTKYDRSELFIKLASYIVHADNATINDFVFVEQQLKSYENIPGNHLHLTAVVRWRFLYKKQPIDKRAQNVIALLTSEQRTSMGNALIRLACINGDIHPKRIDSLKKVLPLLGIESENIHSQVHRLLTDSDGFAVVEKKSDAVEFTINGKPAYTQKPAAPSVTINPKKLRIFEQQTKAAQELLSGIFVEEDATTPQKAETDNAANVWMEILNTLLAKEVWQRAEVDSMCKERGLMLGAVLEQINDYAYEKVDDAVIEDDGDNIYVTLDYKEELI